MSTRPNFAPYNVLNAVSMATSQTSAVTIVSRLSLINYALVWSGTSPVGSVSVQASDDYSLNAEGAVQNAGTWNNLPITVSGSALTAIPVTGNTGNGMIDIATAGFYAVRLIYTATSGTGTLTVTVNAKVA